jgi:hypothetical protein
MARMTSILSASFQSLSLSRRCSYLSDTERERIVSYAVGQFDTDDILADIVQGLMDGETGLPTGLVKQLESHIEYWLARSNAQVEFERSANR